MYNKAKLTEEKKQQRINKRVRNRETKYSCESSFHKIEIEMLQLEMGIVEDDFFEEKSIYETYSFDGFRTFIYLKKIYPEFTMPMFDFDLIKLNQTGTEIKWNETDFFSNTNNLLKKTRLASENEAKAVQALLESAKNMRQIAYLPNTENWTGNEGKEKES